MDPNYQLLVRVLLPRTPVKEALLPNAHWNRNFNKEQKPRANGRTVYAYHGRIHLQYLTRGEEDGHPETVTRALECPIFFAQPNRRLSNFAEAENC